MLEPIPSMPADVIGLRATGTVIEQDVAEAVRIARSARTTGPARRLLLVVDPDLEGYYAELVRGLTAVAQSAADPLDIALSIDDDMAGQAELSSVLRPDLPVRVFKSSERDALQRWLTAQS